MSLETRRIFNHSDSSPKILQELFHNIFISEFLDPSDEIWIVSPWISNIEIFDNRGGAFTTLCPDWQGLSVRLNNVLIRSMTSRTKVNVVANDTTHNAPFFFRLDQRARDFGLSGSLNLIQRSTLHTKGIFTRHGSLTGSMNITYSGVNINDEHLIYTISREAIAQDYLECARYLSGSD